MWKIVLPISAALLFAATPALADNTAQEEANKKVVLELYEKGINQKDFEAAAKAFGPRYIQHNPRAADGPEGFKAFLEFLKAKFPNYHSDIKKIFADGDYVILHVHNVPSPGERGAAIVDIFRWRTARWSSTGTSARTSRRSRLIPTRCFEMLPRGRRAIIVGTQPSAGRPLMERSFKKEVESLKLGEGDTFRGEGISPSPRRCCSRACPTSAATRARRSRTCSTCWSMPRT